MGVRVPADVYVPPKHLAAIEKYMWDYAGDWHVIRALPDTGDYALQCEIDDKMGAVVNVTLDIEPILDLNAEAYNDSNGKRFGDGQVIARVPMSLLYNGALEGLGRALNEGDRTKVKRVLNSSDYRKFRSFRGHI